MSANTFTTSGAFLVGDPEERLAGETPLVEFTCVDNAWNEKRYKAKFITVSCSGKMAEVARQLRAKDAVTVSGRLDYRTYPGRDGNERVAFEIQFPTMLVPAVPRSVLAERNGQLVEEGGGASDPAPEVEKVPAAKRGSRFD